MATFDYRLMSAAAQRYKDRVQGTGPGASAAVVAPSERSDYLSRNLSKDRAQLFAMEATANGARQRPDETVRQIAKERLIGSSDLVDINFLELALAVGRGVARIKAGAGLATGVLVGPGLLMTNNHVIASTAEASTAVAQFDYQDNAEHQPLPMHQFRFAAMHFFYTDEKLDYTIVAVEPSSDKGRNIAEYPWVPLIGQTGKAEAGDPLNIIQHPRGQMKQISFRENLVIEIPRSTKDFLYYTTDTEPGSSGSPCYNDQWELVALHHSGVPSTDASGAVFKRDKTVWRNGVDPEALIDWIANEGGRISAIVTSLQAATLPPEAAGLRSQMLGEKPPNPVELARRSLSGTPANFISEGVTSAMGQSVTLTVPLQITFSIGSTPAVALTPTPAVQPAVIPQPPAAGAGAEEITIDPDWSKRKGYDQRFLGIAVALPKLTATQLADTVVVPRQFQAGGDQNLLNYYHYSVKMNARRRLAWFSAAMIDGLHFFDFKRGRDQWFLDTRIDSKFQMGEEVYTGANTDHGHLTRFKDLSWGANMVEAVNATNDSFHFTNCALQLANFNQSIDRWQGLEQFLLEKHARPDQRKMVVFTGPVFKTTDPGYKNPSMNFTAQIPLAFWKVCVLQRKDSSMAATAFTLGQEDITLLPGFEERLDIATAQVTLRDLETLTALDFGNLTDHDVLAKTGEGGVLETLRADGNKTKVKPITDFSQIVI